MKPKPLAALLALLAAAAPLCALEISLEENRGERGSVGYVDLQAVFRRFPETQRAKQSYAEIVRQAEEQVNLRKAALIALRGDVSRLKAERDLTAKTPILLTLPAPAPAVQPSTAAAPPVPPAAVSPSTQAPAAVPVKASSASLSDLLGAKPPPAPLTVPAPAVPAPAPPLSMEGLPGMSRLPSSKTAASTEPLKINIPGLPEETLPAAKAAEAPLPPAPPTLAQVAAALPAAVSTAPAPVPDATAQAEEQLRRRDAKVKEVDEKIAAKERELAAKEAALKDYEAQVEKNLVDIESKRSEALLGRIYQVVRETARESGVSVVIDKGSILFGQESVDLTDKVLKKLEATLP